MCNYTKAQMHKLTNEISTDIHLFVHRCNFKIKSHFTKQITYLFV